MRTEIVSDPTVGRQTVVKKAHVRRMDRGVLPNPRQINRPISSKPGRVKVLVGVLRGGAIPSGKGISPMAIALYPEPMASKHITGREIRGANHQQEGSMVLKSSRNVLAVFLLLAMSAVLLEGCHRKPTYYATYDIAEGKWYADSAILFSVPAPDTLTEYDIHFNLRHDDSYPNANLYLFIEVTTPGGSYLRDTLNYQLATPQGEWYGRGFAGIWEVRMPYRLKMRFAQEGVYAFRLVQGMRYDPLLGIRTVGMEVGQSELPDK